MISMVSCIKHILAAAMVAAVPVALLAGPATAELAAARSWRPLATLPVAADGLAAISLPDGTVLAVGGDASGGNRIRLTVRFNPQTGTWTRLPDAPVPVATPGLLAIGNDRVLVVAPSFANAGVATPSSVLALNLRTDTWQVLPPCPVPLLQPRLFQLTATAVLAAGGVGNELGAVLDLTTMRWHVLAMPVSNLATYALAPLPANRVMLMAEVSVAAGGLPTAVRRTFALDAAGHWHALARPPIAEDGVQAVSMDDHRVLLAGGYAVGNDPRAPTPPSLIYDPSRNTWTIVGPTGATSRGAQVVPLPQGRALLVGGHGPAGMPSAQCLLFDGRQWRGADSLPGPWSGYALAVVGGTNVLLIGGDRPVGNGFAVSAATLVLVLSTVRG